MTFWYGSGSVQCVHPCLFLMDPDQDLDPDASIFVIDLQDANEKLICKIKFFCLLLFEGTFTSQNSRNEGFSYYFCLMIEGPKTYGSDGSELQHSFPRTRVSLRSPLTGMLQGRPDEAEEEHLCRAVLPPPPHHHAQHCGWSSGPGHQRHTPLQAVQ